VDGLAVVGATPAKLTAGEEAVSDGRDAWLGRRGGGGAGACIFTRRLDVRERVESCDARRIMEGSSVKLGVAGTDASVATAGVLSIRA
jgi:hypothetical protein